MSHPIRSVIFDFGGVISQPMGPLLADLEHRYGMPAESLGAAFYGGDLWYRAERGQMTYDEYSAACIDLMRGLCSEAGRAEQAWEDWYSAFYRPEFMPGMLPLVESLQGRVKVALLSNASPGVEERLKERLGIAHLFDPLLSSATLGCAKPEAQIFRLALERIGEPPDACFFVDDLPQNIAGAAAVGIRGHLFTDAAGLVDALRRHGIEVGLRPDSRPPR